MELLCLKCDESYLRIADENYTLTTVNKASVYPVKDAEMVKTICRKLQEELNSLKIVKLTISEESFNI